MAQKKRDASARPAAQRRASRPPSVSSAQGAAAGDALARFSFFGGDLLWFLVCLTVLVVLPNMYAGAYVPKMFWALATIALAWVFLPARQPAQWSVTPLALIWFAYLGWALLSLAWALQPRVGFERWAILAVWTCGYVAALRTRFWESARFWVLFEGLFIVVCLIGIIQFLITDFPLLSWIPASGLPASTMGHRNYACMYLSVTLPFVAWRFFRNQPRASRILPGLALVFGVAFLIFTRAREAWIAAFVSVALMLAMGALRKLRAGGWLTPRRVLVAAIVLVPLLFIGPAGNVLRHGWRAMPEEKKNILTTLVDPFKRKGDPRLEMWIPALKELHPSRGGALILHGYGFGNYPIASSPQGDSVRTLDYEIHNDYLQALVDLGLPGMILFCAFFLQLWWLSWKGRAQGLLIAAGGAVVGLAVVQFFTFTSENTSPLVWMVGVAAILNGSGLSRPLWSVPAPRWLARSFQYSLAAALLVFAAIVAISIRAEREIFRQMEILRRPNLAQIADEALPRMRFNANIAFIKAHELASLAMRNSMHREADSFARIALSLHPNDWNAMEIQAALAALSGRLQEAARLWEKAAALSANSPSPGPLQGLSSVYEALGKPELAAKAAEAANAKGITKPQNLQPADGAVGVEYPLELAWKPAPNAAYYDIYLWRQGDPAPIQPLVYHVRKTMVRLRLQLLPETRYHWFVIALGPNGQETGDSWAFTTAKDYGLPME